MLKMLICILRNKVRYEQEHYKSDLEKKILIMYKWVEFLE